MDVNQRKEQFSNAYLHAVAAVAGFATAKPSVDDDSVDWTISARRGAGAYTAPKLDVQLKCTHVTDLTATHLRYALKVKNYTDLIDTRLLVPRIMVCVLVPENQADWCVQTENDLVMRRCGYWLSLRGEPATVNIDTVTVNLPRAQLFTPDAVTNLMNRISMTGLI
jgi:hypothetical protein